MTNKTIQKIINRTLRTNGSTIGLNGQEPTSRYMVAIGGKEVVIDRRDFNFKMIRKYAKSIDKGFIGTWLNTDNDKIYLDNSYQFDNKEVAHTFAKKNNQIAFFDLKNMEEIRV